jgi:hypothetical protein
MKIVTRIKHSNETNNPHKADKLKAVKLYKGTSLAHTKIE